jgi:LacI family transcriptional regulator
MNGVTTVDPDLSAKVMTAAELLGYHPNRTAQGLVSGRTHLVGAVVPDLSNPFFHGVLKGLTTAAAISGYGVLVADTGEDPDRGLPLTQNVLSQTDALVLLSPRLQREHLRALAEQPHPVVCVNRVETGVGMPSVIVDEYEAALSLAAHLLAQGHRRVAYLQGPGASWSNSERARALHDAKAFGLECVDVDCGSDMDAGYAAADALFDLDVTAAIAFNDYVALGVLSRLHERGVRIPRDLSLAGFDDIPFARYASPPLTTVRRPLVALGVAAWRALQAMLEGVEGPEGETFRGELVIRDSVAAPTQARAGR